MTVGLRSVTAAQKTMNDNDTGLRNEASMATYTFTSLRLHRQGLRAWYLLAF